MDPDFEAHFDPEDFLEDFCVPYDFIDWDEDYDTVVDNDDYREMCAVDVRFLE